MKSFFATVMLLTGVAVIVFGIGQALNADVTIGDADFETPPIANLEATWYVMDAPWQKAPTSDANYAGLESASPGAWPTGSLGLTVGHGVQDAFVEGQSSFYQDVDGFAADTSYTLTFWSSGATGNYAGLDWSENPLQVTVGSTTLTFSAATTVTPPNAGQWYTSDPFPAPAAGINRLRFTGLGALTSPYPVTAIDDVSVQTVPEPSTLILLAAGLVGLLAYASRKRK